MRRAPLTFLAGACAAAGLSGCGVQAPDLFVVTRTGSIPGARFEMRVVDDGQVSCDHGPLKDLPSDELLDARRIRNDLEKKNKRGDDEGKGPADVDLHLPARPGSQLQYTLREEAGTVAFADNSAGQPGVFYRIAALTRKVAQHVCGRPR